MDIDERLKRFKWDLNAMVRWEKATGRPIDKLDPSSMADFRTMLWCGIEAQVPGITEDEVGAMVTTRNAQAVRSLVDGTIAEASAPNE